MEKLQRDFLWAGQDGTWHHHLVRWEKVCQAKEEGGLGVRRIVPFNKALLGKWLWRYANE